MKKAYHGGGGRYKTISIGFENIGKNKSIVNADGLDAWFNPSPKIVKKINKYLNFAIKTSPPVHADGLVDVISKYRGIAKENILVSAGSSEIMFLMFPNLKIKKALILDPMYGEYKHIFENVLENVGLVVYNLNSENNFEIEVENFIEFIVKENPDLVVMVNPNSPTGKFVNEDGITQILKSIPKETLFVVDETYVDYVDSKQSAESLISEYKNLVIIKSMSKVYGLSGLRVGYLVADKDLIERLERYNPPFQVSMPAQMAGIEALKDIKYYQNVWNQTDITRESFVKQLKTIPQIKIYSEYGNFVLVELLGENSGKATEIVEKLSKKNIFIRNATSMSSQFGDNFLRIAVRDDNSNKKIVLAFRQSLTL